MANSTNVAPTVNANNGASRPPKAHAANGGDATSSAMTAYTNRGECCGASLRHKWLVITNVPSALAAPRIFAHVTREAPKIPNKATSRTHKGLVKPSTLSPVL